VDKHELAAVLARYPELAKCLADYPAETLAWAIRAVEAENTPTVVPVLPTDAPGWEKAFWARREVCVSCGTLFKRGSGNKGFQCHGCAVDGARYEDGIR